MIQRDRILRWLIILPAILYTAGSSLLWMPGGEAAGVPSVSVGGVVNNASYSLASLNLAPGTIAAIFGTDLTDGTSCLPDAGCFPSFDSAGGLRTTMSGAQVLVNGVPVPIFYATPTQLGIQIPTDLSGTSASIRVSVGGQTSAPRTISIDPFSPGIFTVSQNGKGAGAITHADGSLVDASNPARPEEVVIIYATGLGQVTPPIATGTLPGETTRTLTTPTVTIDGLPAQVLFSGLSGCCVGLDQINVRVPVNVHMANNISVVLSIGETQGNIVTIATSATTPLTATPSSIDFGNVPVGTRSTRALTLINTGTARLTISQANVSGPGFSTSGLNLPLTLEVGQSGSFLVTFLPTMAGNSPGSLSITSDVLGSLLVPLSGNGTSTTSQLTITTASLPASSQGTPYNATLAATGGQPPYAWSVVAGILPAGVSLAASTGTISGTPTSSGTFTFTVGVTDANSQAAAKSLSILIQPLNLPLVATTALPNGTQNAAYSTTLGVTGGTPPYSWSVISGSLPAGLTLAASTGVISGTPTNTGTSTFTVQVTDANSQSAPKTLSITVSTSTSPSVRLTWTASISLVAGYNVYRGNASGGPYTKINSVLITDTAYVDGTIMRGRTYFYVVTAVDSLGVEGQFSNEATAVVP